MITDTSSRAKSTSGRWVVYRAALCHERVRGRVRERIASYRHRAALCHERVRERIASYRLSMRGVRPRSLSCLSGWWVVYRAALWHVSYSAILHDMSVRLCNKHSLFLYRCTVTVTGDLRASVTRGLMLSREPRMRSILNAKVVNDFGHESDVASLWDAFMSHPEKTPL